MQFEANRNDHDLNTGLGYPKFHISTWMQCEEVFMVTEKNVERSRHFSNTLGNIKKASKREISAIGLNAI